MSWSRFVSVLAGRRLAFLGVLAGVVLLVWVGTMLAPRQYRASAQVFVHVKAPAGQPAGQLANEADLIRSERVTLAALRLLGMQDDPQLKARWEKETGGRGDFLPWAGEQLARMLDVRPERESTILTITYRAPDAELAARTVNAFVNAYLDVAAQIREEGSSQSAAAFSRGTNGLKSALATAEERLSTFQRENGLASTDERLDVENLRLSELNAQLVAAQSVAAAASGRERLARSGRAGMEEVQRDPLVASLGTELARQEAKLREMGTKLGREHPAMAEQQRTVEAMRESMGSAMGRASSTAATENRIAAERATIIGAALEAQRAKVLQSKAKRDEALRLQREVELARRSYDAAVIRASDSAMDSGAARATVSLLKAATVPSSPAFPRPIVNLVAALLVGLLAGVAAAFWREARDRRLRLDEEVTKLLQHSLVGVLSGGGVRSRRLLLPTP